ncbi:uncharacterized protein LY79DRAFT_550471 [Colletotrichum navitas]|uniref:Uncharacterized protein n=1 Tax=Colletotrichum navitas TaxID=681940 RepID=A0AAD8V725_9PEZI|nr:uncharacterized protein LY79DRAFT_550471 [Colletotrichum navitas]KAK1593975.1 hypothetical protein LY79DRAFT_550471 [Colletotrichum navitas]
MMACRIASPVSPLSIVFASVQSTTWKSTCRQKVCSPPVHTGPNADKGRTRVRSPMASLSRHPKGEKSCTHGGAVAVARLTAIEAVSTIPPRRLLSVPCILPTYHRLRCLFQRLFLHPSYT